MAADGNSNVLGEHLKLNFSSSLQALATGRAQDQVFLQGRKYPCTVAAVVSPGIVTVNFEVNSKPFTLPQVTVPVVGSEYIRQPIKVGDKGMCIAADVRLGGISGLGTGVPDLTAPGNLSGLAFMWLGNTNWPTKNDLGIAIDPTAVSFYSSLSCITSIGSAGLTLTGSRANLSVAGISSLLGGATTLTMPLGDNSLNVATTAYVLSAIASGGGGGGVAGVSSWNGRTGAVSLTTGDITGAGGATAAQLNNYLLLTGGTISGNLTISGNGYATTPSPGNSSTLIATTAFVTNAIAAIPAGGVTSFNGRTGAVSLTTGDITNAGGATTTQLNNYLPLAGGAISGNLSVAGGLTARTMTAGDNSTNVATTAFVDAAIAAIPPGGGGGGSTITISDTAPANPAVGNLWFDSVGLQTYIWYNDPTSSQWTPVTNQSGLLTDAPSNGTLYGRQNGIWTSVTAALGNYLPLTGGTLTGDLIIRDQTPAIRLNVIPGGTSPTNQPQIFGQNNGVNRWAIVFPNNDPETGSDAGSSFALWSCTDAGAYKTNVLKFNRATGNAYFSAGVNCEQLAVNGSASDSAIIYLNKANGANNENSMIQGQLNSVARWVLCLGDGTSETGSDTGSNFGIAAYHDNGNWNNWAFQINRNNLQTYFGGAISATSTGIQYGGGAFMSFNYAGGGNSGEVTFGGSYSGNVIIGGNASGGSQLISMGLNGSNGVVYSYYNNSTGVVYWTITWSDRRLKRNVVPCEIDALKCVNAIPVWSTDFKSPLPGATDEHWSATMIADEVEKELPFAVVQPVNDHSHASLNHQHLISTLWRAVQQLTEQNESLSARVSELEAAHGV